MDLNQSLVDDGSNEEIQQISTMGSFHISTNEVRSEENDGRRPKASRMVLDWVLQITSWANNSNRVLELFQKLNPPVFEGVVNPLQAEK